MDINIAPLGFSNDNLLRKIVLVLSRIFKEVKISYPLINIEKAYSIERRQYYSTSIIESVIKASTESKGYMLIITEFDLYIPALTFIFGEAQLRGTHSIVSVCRLHEEFYTGETDDNLLYTRTVKEILHELGHNFGLYHCFDWDCVMHSSNEIEGVDVKSHYYCTSCRKELREKGITVPQFLLI